MNCLVDRAEHTVLIVSATFCAAVLVGCANGWGRARPVEGPAVPRVVEAMGFAVVQPGSNLDEAYRRALADAERDALMQAHLVLHVSRAIEGKRLKERTVSLRAGGYVQRMEVLESGTVSDFGLPGVRVRVRAFVRPLAELACPGTGDIEGSGSGAPVVVLTPEYDGGDERTRRLLSALRKDLPACGLEVAHDDGGRAALVARVASVAGSYDGGPWLTVEWGISADALAAWESGEITVTARDLPEADYRRLVAALAQAAERLWTVPRRTELVFHDASDAQVRALKEALGPGTECVVDGDRGLVVQLMLAGDPQRAVEGLLSRIGLDHQAEPQSVSLTSLTYRFVSALGCGGEGRAPAE